MRIALFAAAVAGLVLTTACTTDVDAEIPIDAKDAKGKKAKGKDKGKSKGKGKKAAKGGGGSGGGGGVASKGGKGKGKGAKGKSKGKGKGGAASNGRVCCAFFSEWDDTPSGEATRWMPNKDTCKAGLASSYGKVVADAKCK